MQELINKEQAEKEVSAWLDFKKVSPSKRESNQASIDKMVEDVMYGNLVIDQDTFIITHKLLFPIESEIKTTELTYKPRVLTKEVEDRLRGVKAGDYKAMLRAYAAALSGKPAALFSNLYTEDESIWTSLVFFFL